MKGKLTDCEPFILFKYGVRWNFLISKLFLQNQLVWWIDCLSNTKSCWIFHFEFYLIIIYTEFILQSFDDKIE